MQKISSTNLILYEKIILILLIIYSVAGNIYAVNSSHAYSMIQFISMIGIMTLGIFKYFLVYKKNIYSILFFLFLLIILVIFQFSYFTFNIFSLVMAFSNVRKNDIVRIYKYLAITQLLFGFIFSILGPLPMKNYVTGVFTFGFVNENMTGILLAVFVLCEFFKNDGQVPFNKLDLLLLIVVLAIENFLLRDSTAFIMIILFCVFIFFFKSRLGKNKIFEFICIFLPLILVILSFYVSYNFNTASWINKLNDVLSGRIYIWNYYVSNYPLTLFPSGWQINNSIFDGAFDNVYIYLGVFQGKLMLAVTILGLCIANHKLVKQNEFGILAFMLVFEIAGFSENVLFNFNESFALILAFLAFSPEWMNVKKKI